MGYFWIFSNFFLVFRIARYFWYFSKFLSVCFLDYWDFWDLSSSLNFFSDFPGFLRRSWFLRQKNRFFDCSWKKSRIWTFSFSNIAYFSILNIFSTQKINLVTSGGVFFLNRKWISGLNNRFIYQCIQLFLFRWKQY